MSSKEFCILVSWFLRPMSKNLVLEELRKMISGHAGRDMLKSVLKVRDARVKVEWVKREEELSVICVKMVVEGKRRDQSSERGSVHNEEQWAENRALRNTTRGSMKR